MFIDAHQHFWNKDKFNYPWLTPDLGCLYRTFEPADLEPMVKENNVVRTVVVQAMASLDETRFLLQLADENEFIGGIVGWVDLMDPELSSTLDELCKNKKFKGVRHQIEDEKNREWMLQPQVLAGLKVVAEHGLCFDALLKQDQLWQLEKLMEEIPDLKVVLDHCAKPDIAGGQYDGWAELMVKVAKLPIKCKLSGLLTEADHESWKTEDIRKYSDHVLNVFGADRMMFGSDWPVSTMAADYGTSVKTILELLSGCTQEQQEKIMYLNAKNFYGIE